MALISLSLSDWLTHSSLDHSRIEVMNPVAVHRASLDCVSRFSLIRRESGGGGFSGARIVKSRGRNRRLHAVTASLITSADSFEVGRLIGSYGFMNVTRYLLTRFMNLKISK